MPTRCPPEILLVSLQGISPWIRPRISFGIHLQVSLNGIPPGMPTGIPADVIPLEISPVVSSRVI